MLCMPMCAMLGAGGAMLGAGGAMLGAGGGGEYMLRCTQHILPPPSVHCPQTCYIHAHKLAPYWA